MTRNKKSIFLKVAIFITLLLGILSYFVYQHFNALPLPYTPVVEPKITEKIDYILIEKHQRKMTVYHAHQPLKSYRVALGFSPEGHKTQQGDGKTPEGKYTIIHKNPSSQFHLSLKLSYPSLVDRSQAKRNKLNPGGDIMIHGLGVHFGWMGDKHTLRDWTLGCIAVTNEEIEEIYSHTEIGTQVQITP